MVISRFATAWSLSVLLLVAACGAPTIPMDRASADESSDLDEVPLDDGVGARPTGERRDAGPDAQKADASDAGAPDAAPVAQTFAVGAKDCNAGYCKAGYDGKKDPAALSTASQLCLGHGFSRASDFTLVNDRPGGKFCSYAAGAYRCDSSCSGCNPMGTISCAR